MENQNTGVGASCVEAAAKLSKKEQAEADAKLPPRKRVHKAQLNVLQKVDNILDGNCKSATRGNYNCAKFVLDWSGVSDIRTPLAKPLKQKSLASTLLKQLRKVAKEKQQKDGDPANPK